MDWSRNSAMLILIQQMTLEQQMCQNRTSRAVRCVLRLDLNATVTIHTCRMSVVVMIIYEIDIPETAACAQPQYKRMQSLLTYSSL
jgi:hypothetical protein